MMRKMNKNVYGIMMAAMMAASVSVTACGGQKSTGETMTVQTQPHDDSKVSEMPVPSSVADQAFPFRCRKKLAEFLRQHSGIRVRKC